MIFYVYVWHVNDVPEYVGKGTQSDKTDTSRVLHHIAKTPKTFWQRHLRNAINKGAATRVELVAFYRTEQEAHNEEVRLIALHGRKDIGLGSLYNLTDGGEGSVGVQRDEKWRENQRKSQKGHPGQAHSVDTIEQIRQSNLGQKRSLDTIENIRRAATGKILSDATKEKLRQAGLRRWEKERAKNSLSV